MNVSTALSEVVEKFKGITNKPDQFLSIQNGKAKETTGILKELYDLLKKEETDRWQPPDALPELITNDFDEEQIWQEIELQNDGLNNKIVKDVAFLLAKKERLAFDVGPKLEVEEDAESNDEEDEEISDQDDENYNDEDVDFDEDLSDSEKDEEHEEEKLQFTSEVDDDFFKLCEMENYCEKVEKEDDKKSRTGGSSFDLFGNDGEEDEERELVRYNDFFGPAKAKRAEKEKRFQKKVQFAEEEFSENEEMEEPQDDLLEKSDEEMDTGPKSSFEARQERLKKRIESLEEEALKEKPWNLKGEVTSSGRPQNSLLEEYVEFDKASRPAPVFTEKTTLRLEDIIKQRIKDKAWDDVERKVKPVEDIREYRKQLVLDQEKSKLSLAEIYEQEYVKQRDAKLNTGVDVQEEVEDAQHQVIKSMMRSLFTKLDALSNFHYTPKPVAPEIKIISNLPAITMEDVAPVATSDAALLAPEEVKNKPKGELMSKEERTATDKNRERRKKKLKQRVREKEKIKKEKLLSKMPLGLGNKYSKEKAKKTLDRLTKEKNVDKMVETQSKHLKSSSAFFNKLEDEVKSMVKKKDGGKKKKKLVDNISAKKIKL